MSKKMFIILLLYYINMFTKNIILRSLSTKSNITKELEKRLRVVQEDNLRDLYEYRLDVIRKDIKDYSSIKDNIKDNIKNENKKIEK